MALRYHDDGPFYCYRAIETIRHDIGRRYKLAKRDEQWDRTWQVLGGSGADIEIFTELAQAIRHGEHVIYPGEKWRQVISITWDVVEAYMLFLLEVMRGNKQ